MYYLEKRIFEMYSKEVCYERCKGCHERKRQPNKKLCPPKSFFILGENLSDTNQPIRPAFVGKTTWYTSSDLSVQPRGLVYDVQADGLELYSDRSYPYWRFINEVTEKELGLSFEDIFVTNLTKCNVYDKNRNIYTNMTDIIYFENCITIFEKEIEMVKPTHVIFLTNRYFDCLIEKLGFEFDSSRDITDRQYVKQISYRDRIKNKTVCWWHRVFYSNEEPVMHFLRTRHPQGAPSELKDEVANWIKNSITQR